MIYNIMFTHNLDPTLVNLGLISIRWYSLAYIFGILLGWWYGKKIIEKKLLYKSGVNELKEFDNLITYLILSIIIGADLGTYSFII